MQKPLDKTGPSAPVMDLQRVLKSVSARWFVVLGATVGFGLVGWFVESSKPDEFTSTAQLVVRPLGGGERASDFAEVYRSLLKSDRVLQSANQKIVREGIVPEGAPVSSRGLTVRIEAAAGRGQPNPICVVTLTARGESPAMATARVNSWAEAFIEESRSMLPRSGRETESVLEEELANVRGALKDAEAERAQVANRFDRQEVELGNRWAARIASERISFGESRVEFHGQTLQELEKILDVRLAELQAVSPAFEGLWRSRLTELVHAYWKIAATPRSLTLEKAPSDESLNGLLAAGQLELMATSSFETEEANPVYELYAREAARRSSELKREAGDEWNAVSELLIAFEELVFRRTEELDAMRREHRRRLDAMRREQASEVRALRRDRAEELRTPGLHLQDLGDLEGRLRQRINAARMDSLLDDRESVQLASPASLSDPEDRRLAVVTAAWTFMGLLFGLALALITSFPPLASRKRLEADE